MNERRAVPLGSRAVLAAALLCLVSLPAHARAEDPPPPAAPKFTSSLYTGALSILTRGEKREYLAARATVSGPVLKNLGAFARVDATGAQDGGQLNVEDPSTFRTLELAGGLRYTVRPKLSLAAIGGATYSIEGDEGAPRDPRLFTAAALLRYELGDGYVYAGGGHHGPVGGPALLVAASVPVREGTFAIVDFAFPLERNVLREKTWVLKLGASQRVKTLGF
jgi:hypothetical protein